MSSWGVALLCAGSLALLVGTAARALGSAKLSEDEARGARRLSRGLLIASAVQLTVGLLLFLLADGR